jgi:hypothetical protein
MTTLAVTDVTQSEHSTLSWGAVIAGGIAAAALSLFLLALGMGLGLSSISPWSGEGVSATTFKIGAGVYLVCMAMLSSTVGGYLAGRLRGTWAGVHNDEIYFRDTAHGLVTWAFATVLSATVLGAAATHIVGGAASGLAPAAATSINPADVYVDTLLRRDTPSAPGDTAAAREELGRLFAPVLRKGGDLSTTDRAYAARVVSARTGLNPADAERRVNDTIIQAKKAADDARKATASLMLWLAASMLAGAVASILGATEGGLLRDSKWYEPGWRNTLVRNH